MTRSFLYSLSSIYHCVVQCIDLQATALQLLVVRFSTTLLLVLPLRADEALEGGEEARNERLRTRTDRRWGRLGPIISNSRTEGSITLHLRLGDPHRASQRPVGNGPLTLNLSRAGIGPLLLLRLVGNGPLLNPRRNHPGQTRWMWMTRKLVKEKRL